MLRDVLFPWEAHRFHTLSWGLQDPCCGPCRVSHTPHSIIKQSRFVFLMSSLSKDDYHVQIQKWKQGVQCSQRLLFWFAVAMHGSYSYICVAYCVTLGNCCYSNPRNVRILYNCFLAWNAACGKGDCICFNSLWCCFKELHMTVNCMNNCTVHLCA